MSFIINPYRHAGGGGATNGLLTGLVSCWEMTDSSSPITDAHGSNDSTSENGNPTYQQTGIINYSVDYDGTGDYHGFGDINAFDFDKDDTFSMCIWFKARNTGTGAHMMFGKNDGTDGWQFYRHGSPGSYRLYWLHGKNLGTNNDKILVASTSGYNNADWNHFGITYDGSSSATGVTLYVNGSAVTDVDIVNTFTTAIGGTTADFQIAASNSGALMNGFLEQGAIWNIELTADNFAALYNSGSGLSYDNFTS